MVSSIWSGGQTGADQGGLAAAVVLDLDTGGWAPRGYRTEAGPAAWLAHLNLREHPSQNYVERTRQNVQETQGTLLVGDVRSPGSALTLRCCYSENKPVYLLPWLQRDGLGKLRNEAPSFLEWVATYRVERLNVAGNRESKNPGIRDAVRRFLVGALREERG